MKNVTILLLLILGISWLGCKKNNSCDPNPTTINHPDTTNQGGVVNDTFITQVNASFTRKALIEYRTGIWCGACPSAAVNAQQCMDAHSDRVFVAAIHTPPGNNQEAIYNLYDANMLELEDELGYTLLNQAGNPAGTLNRDHTPINSSGWMSQISTVLSETARGGVAIRSQKVGNTDSFNIDIYSGFKTEVSGMYYLQVYLVEDNVHRGPVYDQRNYGHTNPSSPYYQKGDPMPASAYKHHHTLEHAFEKGLWGYELPKKYLQASVLHKRSYNLKLQPEWNAENMSIIAFVAFNNTGEHKYELINVQQVKLGQSRKWD